MKIISVKEHYDLLIAEENDPVNDPPLLQAYMDKWDGQPFIDALRLTPDSNVLEIGVGTGRLAKKVLAAGCRHFTGIDLSPATIIRAKEHLGSWSNCTLINGDFMTHCFDRTFDVIYCSLTLFHFKDKAAFVQKVAKLLPAGRFVVSVSKQKEQSIRFGIREVILYPDEPEMLKALLTAAGFAVSDILETEFAHILVAEK